MTLPIGQIPRVRFGEELVKQREKNKWSQSYVAKTLHLNRNTYANYEKGATEPTFFQGLRICQALGIDPNIFRELFEEKGVSDVEFYS